MSQSIVVMVALLLIYAPFLLASAIADLSHVSPSRLFGIGLLSGLVAGLYELGIIQIGFAWISAEDRFLPIIYLSLVLICFGFALAWWVRRKKFVALQWANSISWTRYKHLCESYFRMRGWKLSLPTKHSGTIDFVASKGAREINVVCQLAPPLREVLRFANR